MRTGQEVLKDFEELGYEVVCNDNLRIELNNNGVIITISKIKRRYSCKGHDYLDKEMAVHIVMQEHKLLNELFKIWRWL